MLFKVNDRVKSIEIDEWHTGLEGTVFQADGVGGFAVQFDGDHDEGWSDKDSGADGSCWWMREQDLVRAPAKAGVRTFATGATRDLDENKLDYEGFLSPIVLEEFAKYMHTKRKMPDGSMRDSDNWQKGIPLDAYMKSMFRHFFAVWKSHRQGTDVPEEDLLALLFNVQGYAHETLRKQHGV